MRLAAGYAELSSSKKNVQERMTKKMKFSEMPYTRIDFARVEEEMKGLMRELQEAGNGEEQFEVHKKFTV